MAAPFAAPPTPFNGALTAQRNIAFAELDLADIKRVKNRFNVTVNDVVMALSAAVLRWYLIDCGQASDRPLVATVPVSVRGISDRPGRNQISGMFCSLQTHIVDPAKRLRAIAAADARAKEHNSAIAPTLLQDWAQVAARAVFGLVTRLLAIAPLTQAPVHNVIISNVPRPHTILYFLGSQVNAMYPFGPIFHGSGLNITVMSLNGHIDVGIISCPDLVSNVWELADNFSVALDELLA
jgi:diacylglycerol O-acyltransferase / wax synthase